MSRCGLGSLHWPIGLRTRAGQLISGIITEVDQTKTVISASLLSFFQNLVVVAVT